MGALIHFLTAALGLAIVAKAVSSRPNIVLIMTDDQDKRLDSLDYQPAVKAKYCRAMNDVSETPLHQRSMLQTRLDAPMMVLKSCKSQSCPDPWGVLHPDGSVTCLQQAMNSTFDGFFQNQRKVSFEEYALGYIVELEGLQDANVFQGPSSMIKRGYERMKGSHCAEWT